MREHNATDGFQVLLPKRTAERRGNAQQWKEFHAGWNGQNAARRATPGQALRTGGPGGCGELVEALAVIAKFFEIRVGVEDFREVVLVLDVFPNDNQALGVFVGQRPQDDRIHNAEDGCVRSNAEPQHQDHEGGEAGRFREDA